jgi:hypothetical protein
MRGRKGLPGLRKDLKHTQKGGDFRARVACLSTRQRPRFLFGYEGGSHNLENSSQDKTGI